MPRQNGEAVQSTISAENEDVRSYFDETVRLYERFWHGPTGALHFGLRDGGAYGHRAELLNTNRVLADAAQIQPGELVFDAGCGVGGSAIWLAEHRGARVQGATVSLLQRDIARTRAAQAGVSDRATFHVCDFLDTGLPAGSFDVVWALESSCYAHDKSTFLREAFRLLRAGGRLIVGDGFLARAPRGQLEARMYKTFRTGLVLPDLPHLSDFAKSVRDAGFNDVEVQDRIGQVQDSSRRLFWRCALTYPLAAAGRRLGLVSQGQLDNSRAGVVIHPLVRRGLMAYGIVRAQKSAGGDHPPFDA